MTENISANTLFHFTSSPAYLKNILAEGIKIGFSLENFESLLQKDQEIGLPMICMCDIPLSRVKEHIDKYGGYGIGLSKAWGMENKFTPVIYSHKDSPATELLNEIHSNIESFIEIHEKYRPVKIKNSEKSIFENLFADFNKINNSEDYSHKVEINKLVDDLKKKIVRIFRYVKPYKGKFYRKGNYLPNEIEFYNEKEWRFVPTNQQLVDIGLKVSYERMYLTELKYKRAISIKCNKLKLHFTPSDVRFIIVKKESEIPGLIEFINGINFEKSSGKALEILKTKIISLEQIVEDL